MATYVLIHGAGADAWIWHLVERGLRARGHDTVAPDLPCDDDGAGLDDYSRVVVDAIGGRTGLTLVAQSMGGLTAPLVAERVPVNLLVYLAGMVPAPGESGGEWWGNTGAERARRELDAREGREASQLDPEVTFFHDLPTDLAAEAMRHGRPQSGTPFEKPWPLDALPDVPTRFLLCRDDRFFPAEFMRRHARERLGVTADEMDGGHLTPLSRPEEVVARLEAFRVELGRRAGSSPVPPRHAASR